MTNFIRNRAYKNRGVRYERIFANRKHGFNVTEEAFIKTWQKDHAKDLNGLLRSDKSSLKTTWKDRLVAATVIQWIGTNCGMAFLGEALRKSGLRIISEKEYEEKNEAQALLHKYRGSIHGSNFGL